MSIGSAEPKENSIDVPLRDVVFQGSKVQLHFDAVEGDQIMVETSQLPETPLEPGTQIKLSFAAADTMVYPTEATS